MATWQLKVQRYTQGKVESRISGVQHVSADDFAQAVQVANSITRGMTAADPESEYRIVSLSSTDYRGTDCEGGIHPFETREEMSQRLEPSKS